MFKIFTKFTLIYSSIFIYIFTFSFSHSILKLTLIPHASIPFVNAFPLRFAIFVLTLVEISICEFFLTISMFEKILKITSINTFFMLENPLSILLIVFPFAFTSIS